jgi:hypothetical protein
MNAKLTLKLNKNSIERAKIYAQQTNQSLSSLVEKYFNFISEKNQIKDFEISPIVREMTGIIQLDDNFDLKDEYRKHLMEKYA